MLKLNTTKQPIEKVAQKYVRLVVTEDPTSWHRLVETTSGILEYRMGAGKWKDMDAHQFRLFIRSIVRAAKSHQIEYLALQLSNSPFPKLNEHGEAWVLSTIAENILLADYEFTAYKTKNKQSKELKEILICGGLNATATKGFTRGLIVGESANITRAIANTPALDMTPTKLAAATKKAIRDTRATVKVLNEAQLKKLKANLLLAVGQGTKEPTNMIVIEYFGAANKNAKPLVLVGKGVTYDTGGLNVKPTGHMHDMHMDMSGGASIIGTMRAIAKLGLKQNVIGIIPAAENSVSAEAMRAGDIITAMNGKTVEVLHTDAEGRLILADALTYSAKYQPKAIIDVATLTGASLVALGQQTSAMMGTDEKLQQTLTSLVETAGERVWPLPLHAEYQKSLKSSRADISNIATSFSRFGGCIEGGAFLQNFVPKKTPWVHIDMAPRMESVAGDNLAKGATGEPVRLLVAFAESH